MFKKNDHGNAKKKTTSYYSEEKTLGFDPDVPIEDRELEIYRTTEETFDKRGNLVEELVKEDRFGSTFPNLDSQTHSIFVYDHRGRIIKEHIVDSDGGGIQDETQTLYTYSNRSDLLRKTSVTERGVGGPEIDSIRTEDYIYTYDYRGNLTGKTFEKTYLDLWLGSEPSLEFRETAEFTYDKRGKALTELRKVDADGDGNLDRIESTVYEYSYKFGRLQSEMRTFETDRGADGTIESKSVEHYTYDWRGNVTSQFTQFYTLGDTGLELDVDRFYKWEGQYDSRGNLVSENIEDARSGVVSISAVYTYDHRKNLLTEVRQTDIGSDGNVNWIETVQYEYDRQGKLIFKTHENDNTATDGVDWTRTELYEYDRRGELLYALKQSLNADGVVTDQFEKWRVDEEFAVSCQSTPTADVESLLV
jgi:hypothetical protein